MNLQPEWFSRRVARIPGNQSCVDLLAAVETLRASATQFDFKPPLDPDEVWKEWQQQKYVITALDKRQIRTLCVCAKTATRPELVQTLEDNLGILSRTACLLGVINAYFANWGTIGPRQRAQKLIRMALKHYDKRTPILVYFKKTDVLFYDDAPNFIAESAVTQKKSVLGHLQENNIGLNTGFSGAALAASISVFIRNFPKQDKRSDNSWLESLRYALTELLVNETPKPHFYSLIEYLILSTAADNSSVG